MWKTARFQQEDKVCIGGVSAALAVLTEHRAGCHTAAGFAHWDGFACPATASITSTVSQVKGMYGASPLHYPALAWRGVCTHAAKAEVLKKKPVSRL